MLWEEFASSSLSYNSLMVICHFKEVITRVKGHCSTHLKLLIHKNVHHLKEICIITHSMSFLLIIYQIRKRDCYEYERNLLRHPFKYLFFALEPRQLLL